MIVLNRWVNYTTIILFVLLLFYVAQQRGRIYRRPLAFIWGLWILIYPISDYLLRSEHTPQLYELLSYGVVGSFLLFADENLNSVKILFVGFKVLAFFELIGLLLQLVFERLYIMIAWRLSGRWSYNMTGFSTDAAAVAVIFAVGIGVIFAELLFEKKKEKKITKFLELLILFVGLVIASKRSILIAVGCVVLAGYLILSSKSLNKILRALFLSIILVAIAVGVSLVSYYLFDSDNALGRLGQTIVGYFDGEDITNMRSLWAEYMEGWRQDNLWFGIGWESFKNRILDTGYYQVPNGHNSYKQILCEEGYIGLTIFIVFLGITLFCGLKNVLYYLKRDEKDKQILSFGSFFISIIFFVYCFFGNAVYDSFIYVFFFASVYIISILNNDRYLNSK